MSIPEPELICFAGDWHGDTQWAAAAIEVAAFNGAKVMIHVGDFGFTFVKSFVSKLRHILDDNDMYLLYVKGNHDSEDVLRTLPINVDGFGEWKYPGRGAERLLWIPQGHMFEFWGKKFLGLGGAHSVDREWRTPYVDWWPSEWITTGDMYRAMSHGKVDVMITHDLPARAKLPNNRKSFGWPAAELAAANEHRILLQTVVDEVQPELLVHGHFHHNYTQMVGSLRVVGLDMNGSTMADNLFIVGPDLVRRTVCTPEAANYPSELQAQVDREKKLAEAVEILRHSI